MLIRWQIPVRMWLVGLGFWIGTVVLSHFWSGESWLAASIQWAFAAVAWTAIMAAWDAGHET